MYEFKLTNTFIDNLKIVFNFGSYMLNEPQQDNDLFYHDNTLVPYYKEQPKIICLRKLKKELLKDSRIKTGIEN